MAKHSLTQRIETTSSFCSPTGIISIANIFILGLIAFALGGRRSRSKRSDSSVSESEASTIRTPELRTELCVRSLHTQLSTRVITRLTTTLQNQLQASVYKKNGDP